MTTSTPIRPAGGRALRTPDAPHRPHRRRYVLVALIAALTLVAAACGDSNDSNDTADNTTSTTAASSTTAGGGYGDDSSATTTAGAASAASLAVATTSLGDIVVDSEGYTLYLYEPDPTGSSTCINACASSWPPALVTGTPTAGPGVTGELTTTTRADGTTQLVFGGHPLYRYSLDKAPGEVKGQDVGEVWYVLSPSGAPIE